MRIITFLLLLIFASPVFSQTTEQIKLPGFGEIPVTKTGDLYSVKLRNYGTFDFKGSINPLELESTVTIGQMSKLPGYEIYKNLGLEDITLNLSGDGFIFEANADTRKNLATLCDAFNITAPFIKIKAKIARDGFATQGALSFEDDPIEVIIIPSQGTKYSLVELELGAKIGISMPGAEDEGDDSASGTRGNQGKGGGKLFDISPEIGVKTTMGIQPTKWDPDLETVVAFSYNLVTQEITGSGSMVGEWSNPFNLSKFLAPETIVLADAAIEMGYIPGSPTPTNIGFHFGRARLFGLEYTVAMSMAPADKQIAVKAGRPKMTMNQFTDMLQSFKLNVPDIFPDEIYIEDVEITMAPAGAEIGEFELDDGLRFKGVANFRNTFKGDINFIASVSQGFFLDYNIDADFKRMLMNELRKVKPLAPVMDRALSTLQVRKVNLHLEANREDLKLAGKTHVKFEVFDKTFEFDVEGQLDPQKIAEKAIDKIVEEGEVLQMANKVRDVVGGASKKAYGIASNAFNDARKELGTVARHTHGKEAAESAVGFLKTAITERKLDWENKSKTKCDKECVPRLARNMADPMLRGTNNSVSSFYNEVMPSLRRVVGDNESETKEMRKKIIWNDWKKLAQKIDKDWASIIKDDTYIRFYIKPSSATNGGHIYRRLVRKERDEHKKFRLSIWEKMLTEVDRSNELYNVYRIYSVADEDKSWDIPGLHFNARTKGGKLNLYKDDNGADRFIKVIDSDNDGVVMFQPQHSDCVVDVTGGSSATGNHMQLWHQNNTASQRFKLIEVPGKIDTYFIETKDGLYLTSGRTITQETPTKTENQMWYFEKAYTSEMDPPKSDKYRIRSMAGKKLYIDVPGRGEGIDGKDAYLQLWSMDSGPDRTIQISNEKDGNLFTLQPLHGKWVFDVEGYSHSKGARIQLYDKNKTPNQFFEFVYAGAPMVYQIRCFHSGKFLDASAGGINQNGCKVQQWAGHNGDNQKWKLESVGPHWAAPPKDQAFFIRPAYSKKYWDLGGDGAETNKKGKRFKLWTLNGGGDRKFKFKPTGDHSWLNIQVQNGGRQVDCKGGKVKSNGTPLHLWDAHGGDSQKFAIKPTGPNTFVLLSKGYKAVDIKSGDIHDNGAEIHLWSQHYGASQQFVIEYADGPKRGQVYKFPGF
ncbi:RICIN domain-containing protein [Marinilabilia rubra]|uniref:Ricin B lectin domain-containing protein n=1 Tax=Marinilabilia rubra TaxID=2162893 RepID=A0A2U2BCY8_9BACT|nr:RICIN domain-containing protein [Marinilabilia rubra]PWE00936.1 hypothetical protein DDZ16_00130 [Marinilabilia rubra]